MYSYMAFQSWIHRKCWSTNFTRNWCLMCLFKWVVHENDDPQNLQEYGFHKCVLRCVSAMLNQICHKKMGSLQRVHRSLFRVALKENTVPQTSRENGFSAAYVSMCFPSVDLSENTDLEISQWVFSCVFLCVFLIFIL